MSFHSSFGFRMSHNSPFQSNLYWQPQYQSTPSQIIPNGLQPKFEPPASQQLNQDHQQQHQQQQQQQQFAQQDFSQKQQNQLQPVYQHQQRSDQYQIQHDLFQPQLSQEQYQLSSQFATSAPNYSASQPTTSAASALASACVTSSSEPQPDQSRQHYQNQAYQLPENPSISSNHLDDTKLYQIQQHQQQQQQQQQQYAEPLYYSNHYRAIGGVDTVGKQDYYRQGEPTSIYATDLQDPSALRASLETPKYEVYQADSNRPQDSSNLIINSHNYPDYHYHLHHKIPVQVRNEYKSNIYVNSENQDGPKSFLGTSNKTQTVCKSIEYKREGSSGLDNVGSSSVPNAALGPRSTPSGISAFADNIIPSTSITSQPATLSTFDKQYTELSGTNTASSTNKPPTTLSNPRAGSTSFEPATSNSNNIINNIIDNNNALDINTTKNINQDNNKINTPINPGSSEGNWNASWNQIQLPDQANSSTESKYVERGCDRIAQEFARIYKETNHHSRLQDVSTTSAINQLNNQSNTSNYPIISRRKNATRETTRQLKDWLSKHLQNPYPTKLEKLNLTRATSMNMVQVSTWFANARRRMKKEKKPFSGGQPDPTSMLQRSEASSSSGTNIEKRANVNQCLIPFLGAEPSGKLRSMIAQNNKSFPILTNSTSGSTSTSNSGSSSRCEPSSSINLSKISSNKTPQ